MPSQIVDYKCPSCTAPLRFDGTSGKLECDYCGSSYDIAAIEAMYAEQERTAQQAHTEEERGDAEWDMSGMSNDWSGDSMKVYICPSCGAELLCDATTAATSCPYCGNQTVVPGQFSGILKPDCIIPFKLSREDAKTALKNYYYNTCKMRKHDVHLEQGKVRYALLPVYMLHTKWEGKDYLFAMNGQTGKLIGDLPVSRKKYWAWFCGIAATLTVVLGTAIQLIM